MQPFFGLGLSATHLFKSAIESEVFLTLENIGMFFLLFLIGFNLEFKKIGRMKKHVLASALSIVAFEGLFVSLVLHFLFPTTVSYSYLIAIITGLSFATVGEAVLLPILAEFKIIKTTFGQLTLSIGTIDDIIEVLMLTLVTILSSLVPALQTDSLPYPTDILSGLMYILALTLALLKVGGRIRHLLEKNNPPPFVFFVLTLLVCFLFIALGDHFGESLAAVSAIFGGMVLRGCFQKSDFIKMSGL